MMKTNKISAKETLMSYILSLTPEKVDKIIDNLPLLQSIISKDNHERDGGTKNGR